MFVSDSETEPLGAKPLNLPNTNREYPEPKILDSDTQLELPTLSATPF